MRPPFSQKMAWALGVSAFVLAGFHLTANHLDFPALGFEWLDSTPHTAASIWIRIGSLPLRLVVLVGLARYLARFQPAGSFPSHLPVRLLQIWTTLCGYYVADLLIHTVAVSDPICAMALVLTAAFVGGAILYPTFVYIPASGLFLLLTFLVHDAQRQSGENNAFTLFGIQGLALITAVLSPAWSARLLWGLILIPAFGYIFPLSEKLMLNPLGWAGGTTFQRFAALLGYSLPYFLCLLGSWLLLLFQASFLIVLRVPSWVTVLYPAAVLFHLIAGLALGFGASLNPWIPALLLSWSAFQAVENTART